MPDDIRTVLQIVTALLSVANLGVALHAVLIDDQRIFDFEPLLSLSVSAALRTAHSRQLRVHIGAMQILTPSLNLIKLRRSSPHAYLERRI